MNSLEKQLVNTLSSLRDNYGVKKLKAEFENEGTRLDELARLKDVVSKSNMELLVKIGGVEAVTDMYNCLVLGVDAIVAPMAETAFAVSKFTDSIDKFMPDDNQSEIDFLVNIETIDAIKNFDEMLKLPNINNLSGITIGRVDLSASLGKDRSFANSKEMMNLCETVFAKAREHGFKHCTLGGAISLESRDFVCELADKGLIDYFETRKVVYPVSSVEQYNEALLKGIEFELGWLKSKKRYYKLIHEEDDTRISMIETRLNG